MVGTRRLVGGRDDAGASHDLDGAGVARARRRVLGMGSLEHDGAPLALALGRVVGHRRMVARQSRRDRRRQPPQSSVTALARADLWVPAPRTGAPSLCDDADVRGVVRPQSAAPVGMDAVGQRVRARGPRAGQVVLGGSRGGVLALGCRAACSARHHRGRVARVSAGISCLDMPESTLGDLAGRSQDYCGHTTRHRVGVWSLTGGAPAYAHGDSLHPQLRCAPVGVTVRLVGGSGLRARQRLGLAALRLVAPHRMDTQLLANVRQPSPRRCVGVAPSDRVTTGGWA